MSFVVVAYNEERNIARCLAAISAQADIGRSEVIVVDDGSTDNTVVLAEATFGAFPPGAAVRVIRHGNNRGRGAARATGVAAARGRWVAMVDADIVVPAHWLSYCRSALLAGSWDAVGGVPVPDGDCTFIYNRFGLQAKVVRPTIAVSGTNGLFKKEVFEQVAIDRSLTEGEDVALNHAITARGFRLGTLTGLRVEHAESKGFGRSVRWLYQSGLGASRQLVRYGEVRVPDIALAGQAGALLAGAYLRRRRPRLCVGLPVAYLLATALAHLGYKFSLKARPAPLLGAWAADTVLLGSYFTGRVVGLAKALARVPERA